MKDCYFNKSSRQHRPRYPKSVYKFKFLNVLASCRQSLVCIVMLLWGVCINSHPYFSKYPHSNQNSDFLFVVANDCKLEVLSSLMRPIYVPSLVTVAKTNPTSFWKGGAMQCLFHGLLWAFASVYLSLILICVFEFHEVQSMLSRLKITGKEYSSLTRCHGNSILISIVPQQFYMGRVLTLFWL